MSDVPTDQTNHLDGSGRYEIRVKGHLAPRWTVWFDGMTLSPQGDGTTVVHGPVADQSALHGLLRKLNDLGLPLVSVTSVAADEPPADRATEPPADRATEPPADRATDAC